MAYKPQYVTPKQFHYEVWRRRDNGTARLEISHICDTVNENTAADIAAALAGEHKYMQGVSYVVRAKPTKAHNTLKFYTDEEYELDKEMDDLTLGFATTQIAQRIVDASVNGNGKPSPTVVKAVQKVLPHVV